MFVFSRLQNFCFPSTNFPTLNTNTLTNEIASDAESFVVFRCEVTELNLSDARTLFALEKKALCD